MNNNNYASGQKAWRKSSYSMANGHCVEVACLGDFIGVRDSKAANGPILAFGPAEWKTFLSNIRIG